MARLRKWAYFCPVCEKKVWTSGNTCPDCGCSEDEGLEDWEDDIHNPALSPWEVLDDNH